MAQTVIAKSDKNEDIYYKKIRQDFVLLNSCINFIKLNDTVNDIKQQ